MGNVVALRLRRLRDGDYAKRINAALPLDASIRVLAARTVADDFDARLCCTARSYKFLFFGDALDTAAMQSAAHKMVGAHDFRNLCKMDVVNVAHFEREIESVRVEREDSLSAEGLWSVNVTGKGFLWHQIRCTVAVLLMVGARKEQPEIMAKLLNVAECARKPHFEMASALPLILAHCRFDADDLCFDDADGVGDDAHLRCFAEWHQSWRERIVRQSVRRLFWQHCEGKADAQSVAEERRHFEQFATVPSKKRRRKPHKPLMLRAREESLEEKLKAMKNSKLRKFNEKQQKRLFYGTATGSRAKGKSATSSIANLRIPTV